MRLLLLWPLLVACSSGDALVVVTVRSPSANLTGLLRLHANATAAGHGKEFDVSFTDGSSFDLPPDRTFGVQLPEAYTGSFSIGVDAIGPGDVTLGSGADSTNTSPGRRSDVTILLGQSGDMGADGCTPMSCAAANYGCGTLSTCGMDVDCGPCILTSLHPSIARGGDVVTLEGAFNPTALVSFPGGVTAKPTLLGPNRATVQVPATAGSGGVGLELPTGTVLLKQPFRRVGFTPGLNAFHQVYEQTDVARPAAYLPIERWSGGAAVVGNALELFGGEATSAGPSPVPAVELATANLDGTVGLFTLDAQKTLATPRSNFAVYTSQSWLYVIGGYDAARNSLATVERAAVRPDGAGSDGFSVAGGVALQQGRWLAASAVIGPWLYVFGGGNGGFAGGGQLIKTIERAPIANGDGALGPFETVTLQTASARAGAVAVVLRDKVYLIGGVDSNGTFLKSIEAATINGDGTLGAFAMTPLTLGVDRAVAGAVELGGQVYVLGGISGSATPPASAISSIEIANLNANGNLGTFSAAPFTLADKRIGQPVFIGNWLYHVSRGGGAGGATVERASIIKITNPGTFADSGHSLSQPTAQMAAVVIGPDVYLIGGQKMAGPSPNILHARADADGNLSAFNGMVNGSPLPDLLHGHAAAAAAAFDRDVWVCGGVGVSDCETFHVQPDGSITSPVVVNDMGTKRAHFHLVALEAQLFAVGGDTGGWDSVQALPLDANRRPAGAWGPSVTGQFVTRAGARMGVVLDGSEYAIDGDNGLAGVEVATWSAGVLGSFTSTTVDAGPVHYEGALLALGPWLVIAGGADAAPDGGTGTPLDAVFVAGSGPPLGNFTDSGRHLLHARRGHSGLVLGNFVHLIGGNDGTGIIGSIEQAPLQ